MSAGMIDGLPVIGSKWKLHGGGAVYEVVPFVNIDGKAHRTGYKCPGHFTTIQQTEVALTLLGKPYHTGLKGWSQQWQLVSLPEKIHQEQDSEDSRVIQLLEKARKANGYF